MSVERLAELLQGRQPCVVLTGAGISTESGIPDFRSAEGIWAKYDPFEVAHIDAFRRDPARVWEFYALRLDVLASAEPNAGHHALARPAPGRVTDTSRLSFPWPEHSGQKAAGQRGGARFRGLCRRAGGRRTGATENKPPERLKVES